MVDARTASEVSIRATMPSTSSFDTAHRRIYHNTLAFVVATAHADLPFIEDFVETSFPSLLHCPHDERRALFRTFIGNLRRFEQIHSTVAFIPDGEYKRFSTLTSFMNTNDCTEFFQRSVPSHEPTSDLRRLLDDQPLVCGAEKLVASLRPDEAEMATMMALCLLSDSDVDYSDDTMNTCRTLRAAVLHSFGAHCRSRGIPVAERLGKMMTFLVMLRTSTRYMREYLTILSLFDSNLYVMENIYRL